MADIVSFSYTKGTADIDFDNKRVIYERNEFSKKMLHVPSITINFSDITDVEMKPSGFLTNPVFCLIVKGKRLMSDAGIDITEHPVAKSDASKLSVALGRIVKECNLSGIKDYNRASVTQALYSNVLYEKPMEHRRKCNVCGKVYCFTDADLKRNVKLAKQAVSSSILGVGEALVGTRVGSYSAQNLANNAIDKVVDYNRCPYCNSTDISAISESEFKMLSAQKEEPKPQFSSADELKKFKELLDMGVITQEEFDAKKK